MMADSQKNYEQEVKASTTIIIKKLNLKATDEDLYNLFNGF